MNPCHLQRVERLKPERNADEYLEIRQLPQPQIAPCIFKEHTLLILNPIHEIPVTSFEFV